MGRVVIAPNTVVDWNLARKNTKKHQVPGTTSSGKSKRTSQVKQSSAGGKEPLVSKDNDFPVRFSNWPARNSWAGGQRTQRRINVF